MAIRHSKAFAIRRATSDLLVVLAGLLVAFGWALAFTAVGAWAIYIGMALGAAAVLLFFTVRRLLLVIAISTFFFYYVGALILVALVGEALIRPLATEHQ